MKTPTTPDEWAVYHCECFAIVGEAELNGILTWARTFARAGVSVADLVAATDWMILNVAPQWRREHLAHIQQCIQRFKILRLAEKTRIQIPTSHRCEGCDGTGFISVPHPKDIADGVWGGKYDCVVACPCHTGDSKVSGFAKWREERRKQNGYSGEILGLRTLIDYEREFPNWREMAFRKRDHVREMAMREKEAAYADKRSGPLAKRIAGRIADSMALPK